MMIGRHLTDSLDLEILTNRAINDDNYCRRSLRVECSITIDDRLGVGGRGGGQVMVNDGGTEEATAPALGYSPQYRAVQVLLHVRSSRGHGMHRRSPLEI